MSFKPVQKLIVSIKKSTIVAIENILNQRRKENRVLLER